MPIGTLRRDAALTADQDDDYNSAADAAALVEVVAQLSSAQGHSTVGLYGPWGSGKTSVLNLAASELTQRRLHVVRPHCWQDSFGGPGALTLGLTDAMLVALGDPGRLRRRAAQTAKAASKLVDALPVGGSLAGTALQYLAQTYDARETLMSRLATTDAAVVVLIDDVDRLDGPGLRELFSAVHADAERMPVTFVLAMDDGEVAHLLEQTLHVRVGSEYLEKMVSVALPVSPPSPQVLFRDLLEGLAGLIGPERAGFLDSVFDRDAFGAVVRPYLRTPRDVKRYLNRVAATAAALSGAELVTRDYLIVEALALFDAKLHEALRTNRRSVLLESQWFDEEGAEVARAREFTASFLGENAAHLASRRAALRYLFPNLQEAIKDGRRRSSWRPEPRSAAHPAYFDRYFQRSAVMDDIPDSLVAAAWHAFLSGSEWGECFPRTWHLLEDLVWEKLHYVFQPGQGLDAGIADRLGRAFEEQLATGSVLCGTQIPLIASILAVTESSAADLSSLERAMTGCSSLPLAVASYSATYHRNFNDIRVWRQARRVLSQRLGTSGEDALVGLLSGDRQLLRQTLFLLEGHPGVRSTLTQVVAERATPEIHGLVTNLLRATRVTDFDDEPVLGKWAQGVAKLVDPYVLRTRLVEDLGVAYETELLRIVPALPQGPTFRAVA